MKSRKWIRLLTTAAMAVLIICAASAALAAGQSFALQDEAWTWVYVPSTLPDWLPAREWSYQATIYGSGKDEMADSITIEFVSGDEALKDAVKYRERVEESYWIGGKEVKNYRIMELYIDNDELKAPGRAVFHITLKYKNSKIERDRTLRVLDWNEYPLYTPPETPVNLTAKVGATLREDTLLSLMGTFNNAKIISEIKEGDEQILDRTNFDASVHFWNTEDKLKTDYVWDRYYPVEVYQVLDYGFFQGSFSFDMGNVSYHADITLNVVPYAISGKSTINPGESAQYSITDEEAGSGRTFAWSAEGEGITFDAESATVTALADTPEGTNFTITATPSDGRAPVMLRGCVGSGLLSGKSFTLAKVQDGFSFPMIDGFNNSSNLYWARSESTDTNAANQIVMDFTLYDPLEEFAENRETAIKYYDNFDVSDTEIEEDILYEKDGHPVRLIVCSTTLEGYGKFSLGFLIYARNNRIIRGRLFSLAQNGTEWEGLPKVTMEDMKLMADNVTYDSSRASITVEDGAITITAKDDVTTVSGGKKLQLTAAFANPERVNKKEKNDALVWTVTDPATGEAPEYVTVDKKGTVSADKKLAEVKEVEVHAESEIFHVSSSFKVTAIPAVTRMLTDPEEVFLYTGSDTTATVQTILEPDTVPLTGITWAAAREGIAEITPAEDGKATIKALAAGKVNVTVNEPGGKKATLKVNVAEPVTGLELAVSGKPTPGGSVKVKETLEPKTAGNKAVEWSVDVGEDIATISKGVVKIAKTAPVGTVITVTCTAIGAPESIVKTVQIEVAGK